MSEHRLNEIWESWDYHIEKVVESLDRKVYIAISDATMSGVPYEKAVEFFAKKLSDTIEEVARQRENESKRTGRRFRAKGV